MLSQLMVKRLGVLLRLKTENAFASRAEYRLSNHELNSDLTKGLLIRVNN
jgi:hypothetical protein